VGIDVRNEQGEIIARIDRAGWVVNRNTILSSSTSPDASTISVENEYGDEVLHVHYVNPRVMQIYGELLDKYGKYDISKMGDSPRNRNRWDGNCMSANLSGPDFVIN
jgi:hypothetical protein